MAVLKDQNQSRKGYAAPRLHLYGSVQALTASGTGTSNEAPVNTWADQKCRLGPGQTWSPSMSTFKHCY